MKVYIEEQVNDLMVLLQQSFLPENIECDGAYCMGCWKDVVRETLKKMANLSPIELPSDEEIEKFAQIASSIREEKTQGEWIAYKSVIAGAKWVIEQIKQ